MLLVGSVPLHDVDAPCKQYRGLRGPQWFTARPGAPCAPSGAHTFHVIHSMSQAGGDCLLRACHLAQLCLGCS